MTIQTIPSSTSPGRTEPRWPVLPRIMAGPRARGVLFGIATVAAVGQSVVNPDPETHVTSNVMIHPAPASLSSTGPLGY